MPPQNFLALPDLCRPGGAQRIPYPTLTPTPTLPYLRRQLGVDALQQVRTVVNDHLERDHVTDSAHAFVCACCPRPVHLQYREWLSTLPTQAKPKGATLGYMRSHAEHTGHAHTQLSPYAQCDAEPSNASGNCCRPTLKKRQSNRAYLKAFRYEARISGIVPLCELMCVSVSS